MMSQEEKNIRDKLRDRKEYGKVIEYIFCEIIENKKKTK